MAGPNRTGPGRTALGARSAAPRSPPRRAPRCRTAAPRPGDPLPAPPRPLSPAQGRRSHPPTLRGSPLDALPSGVSPLCLSPDAGSPGPAVARRGDGRGTPRPPPASRTSPEGGSCPQCEALLCTGTPPLEGTKSQWQRMKGCDPLDLGTEGQKAPGSAVWGHNRDGRKRRGGQRLDGHGRRVGYETSCLGACWLQGDNLLHLCNLGTWWHRAGWLTSATSAPGLSAAPRGLCLGGGGIGRGCWQGGSPIPTLPLDHLQNMFPSRHRDGSESLGSSDINS